jgi:glycosyltransferase involved in cell wall biosynthesis
LKILHINTNSHGGAFTGAYRLHKALLKAGVSSKMLVRDIGDCELDNVFEYKTKFKHTSIVNKVLTKFKIPYTAEQRIWNYTKGMTGEYEIISFPFSDYDITKSTEYQEADIIHLHWIAGFLDYKTFFKKNKKPIVWTLRDRFPFLGIFHLQNDLTSNDEKWRSLDSKMQKLKVEYLKDIATSFRVVGISNNIKEQSLSSKILGKFLHDMIHNCLDIVQYKKIDKQKARSILNIDLDKIVFCFVADNVQSANKGYKELKEAFKMIDNRMIEVISAGSGMFDGWPLSIRHRHLGRLSSSDLQVVYSASDALIFPTKEEALGNVMLEAMACGTPVIGTPVGGLLDVIKDGFNGLFAEDCSAVGIKNAILKFIDTRDRFNPEAIRAYIETEFSEQRVANAYIELYSTMDRQIIFP